jgi:ABC-type multidrug transport system fused ATPase/permease subunit
MYQGLAQVSSIADFNGPSIEVKNMKFTYPGLSGRPAPNAKPLITNMTMTLSKGDRCLLVGANGAGKPSPRSLLSLSESLLFFERSLPDGCETVARLLATVIT